ncbi:MAG: hypothetical protein NTZ55_01085 [Candidatus Roizmanbacteria bacterium]|nr:hypothetical protein [Candidatus Roizmanbacteria bacterium]
MRVHLNRKIFFIIGVLITLVCFVLILSYFAKKNSGLWVCKNNHWVKQGVPSYSKPNDPCGKKERLPKIKEECLQIGGVWKKLGPDPFETCNMKASDRGTICTDNSECEGLCQANITHEQLSEGMRGKTFSGRGTCSVWRVELGCMGVLEEGKIKVLCID